MWYQIMLHDLLFDISDRNMNKSWSDTILKMTFKTSFSTLCLRFISQKLSHKTFFQDLSNPMKNKWSLSSKSFQTTSKDVFYCDRSTLTKRNWFFVIVINTKANHSGFPAWSRYAFNASIKWSNNHKLQMQAQRKIIIV